MAQQADGTVYIDTLLDTTGFKAGGKDVEAAVRRMSKTVSGIGATAKIALQKQTDAFVKANQAYAQQEQKVDALKNKLKEMSEQKVATDEFKEIGKQIEDDTAKLNRLEKAQELFLEAGGRRNSTAYRRREIEIEELRNSIKYAKGEQEDLLNTGGAYKAVDTSGVEHKLFNEEQRLQNMNNSLSTSYAALKNRVDSYSGSAVNLVSVKERLVRSFSSLLSSARKTAKTIGGTLLSALKKAGAAIFSLHKNTRKSNASLGSSLKTMLKYGLGIRSIFVLVNRFRSALVDGFKNLAQYNNRTNASISSLMSALTQLKNSFATAFAPILNVVAPILTTFINMIARAVSYVGMLIAALTGQDTFIKAAEVQEDYAGALGDTAGGYKDAKKAQDKYLSGLDEIQRYETPDNDSGSSGGGGGVGGGTSAGDMFETVPIENSLKNLADKIKDAWADSDFTEIGTILGGKLRDALDSIPWDTIQDTAEGVGKSLATLINGGIETAGLADSIGNTVGQLLNTGILGAESFVTNLHFDSIGGFIADAMNSAVSTIKWEDIANVISTSLNGVFSAAATWSQKFDFAALGEAIKTLINSTLTGIDWGTAITAASNIASGIATSLNTFITADTFSNIGGTFAGVVNTVISGAYTLIGKIKWKQWGKAIASSINTFFTDTDWTKLGLTFGNAATGILNTLTSAVKGISWDSVGYNIANMIKSIKWSEVLQSAADLVGSTFAGLLDFGKALLEGFDSNEWTEFNSNINNTLGSLRNTNDELEERIENAKKWQDAGAEYDYAEDLVDKYFDLAEKEKRTNEETEEMKGLARKLVQTLPDLEEYYNSETGLLDTTRTSVDNLIEALKTKARTEAAHDSLKEYYEIQLDAKEAMEESGDAAKELNDHYEEQKKKYDELNEKIEEATEKYGVESGEVYNLVGQQASYKEEMIKTEKKLDDVNKELEDSKTQYNNAGTEIDKITGYLAEMNEEAGTSNTKLGNLNTTLSELPKDTQIKVQAILNNDSLTLEEKKIQVAAEITGLENAVPLSKRKIDDIWAEVTDLGSPSGKKLSLSNIHADISSTNHQAGKELVVQDVDADIARTQRQTGKSLGVKDVDAEIATFSEKDGINKHFVNFDGDINTWNDKAAGKTFSGFDGNVDKWNDTATNKTYSGFSGNVNTWNDTATGKTFGGFSGNVGTWNDVAPSKTFGGFSGNVGTWNDVAPSKTFGGFSGNIGAWSDAASGKTFGGFTGNVSTWKNAASDKTVGGFTGNIGTWVDKASSKTFGGFGANVASFADKIPAGSKVLQGFTVGVAKVEAKTGASTKAEGGIYYSGRWHNIAAAARGGAFDIGQLFVAREAGPELVGTIGGHTAVMNNNQIVASVAAGVYKAVVAAFGRLNNYFVHMSLALSKLPDALQSMQMYQPVSAPVPVMASGTVIPPKALYDYKGVSQLQQTVEDLSNLLGRLNIPTQQSGGSNNSYTFIGQINRRTLFEEVMTEAELARSQTGRNPFEM